MVKGPPPASSKNPSYASEYKIYLTNLKTNEPQNYANPAQFPLEKCVKNFFYKAKKEERKSRAQTFIRSKK